MEGITPCAVVPKLHLQHLQGSLALLRRSRRAYILSILLRREPGSSLTSVPLGGETYIPVVQNPRPTSSAKSETSPGRIRVLMSRILHSAAPAVDWLRGKLEQKNQALVE